MVMYCAQHSIAASATSYIKVAVVRHAVTSSVFASGQSVARLARGIQSQ